MFKLNLFILYVLVLLSIANISAQTPSWVSEQSAGGASDDACRAQAVDSAGNRYFTGFFTGTATFGTTTLTCASSSNCFVAKVDTYGNWLWIASAGGTGACEGMDIDIDPQGNAYITGSFNGNSNFGLTSLNTGGEVDVFVAKLDSNGNWVWAKSGGGSYSDAGRGIAVDNSGNVFLVGDFNRNATFGPTSLSTTWGTDVYIVKLDTDGLWSWAKQAGGANNDYGFDIDVDEEGDAFFTGYFSGSIAFGDSTLTSNGSNDIYVAKINAVGSWEWIAQGGGTSNDHCEHIAVDNAGSVFVTGGCNGAANFGSIAFNGLGGFVAQLDVDGTWVWLRASNGSTMYDVSTDNNQNVYLTGGFFSIAIFGSITIYGAGGSDIFAAKLDNAGNWMWVAQAGGTNEDYGMDIGTDAAGNTYLAGTFYQSCYFETSSLNSMGQKDIFIAKLGPATAVEDELLPQLVPFYLKQNSPNPFSNLTKIIVDVKDNQSPYTLVIYDIKGRKVLTLHDATLSKGENIFTIKAKDILGDKLSSGLYYYRLSDGVNSQTKKMVLIR